MKSIVFALGAALLSVACGGAAATPPAAPAPAAPAPVTPAPPPAPAQAASVAAPPAAAPAPSVPDSIRAAVDAPDRSAEDRALDAGRRPAETLAFFGIKPGMRVAELGAGGGYTSELLARVVGPKGKVYGQNSKFIIEHFAEKPWSARLAKPVNANIVRVDREFDSPLPPDAKNLDAVVIVLFYHDTVWMKTNRDAMNAAVFKALKPGGVYGIVDHAAADGHGTDDAKTLHRIEERVVKQEVEKAGFKLDAEGDFLRNRDDKHDWSASPKAAGDKRGTSDRFALRFVKP